MFSKNLTYYRLKMQMTKKDLAERIHVSPMTITNYENGSRKPDMEILKALANELGVKVSDFLAVRNEGLVFSHGEFRKNSSLTKSQQEYVQESVEEYFGRFMTAVEILGGDVLPTPPICHALKLSNNDEENALALREHLGFATDGPIDDLIGKLENKGILIYLLEIDNPKFSGRNGLVNNRPYIVLNKSMTPERNRSTIVHELAHLMFEWPIELGDPYIEKKATAIGGAFLFPKNDAIRELGIRRRSISRDKINVAIEYGISMMLLAKRAEICNIISGAVAKDFFINASIHHWRTNEPTRISPEIPALFRQLVCRAVNEEEISLQRGAELLKISYDQIVEQCCFNAG